MSKLQPVRNFLGKHSNLPWLEDRTILLVRHGSHAYGTNIATSDEDFKGVAVPPAEYFHGFSRKFEQAESHSPDAVIYDIRKFMQLAADCNPNIIEVLWGDSSNILSCNPQGALLIEARSEFLSKKARFTFAGYAIAQLQRIQTHRKWLLDPPTAPPVRSHFGLSEAPSIAKEQLQAVQSQVQKQLDRWNEDFSNEVDEATKIQIREHIAQYLTELQIAAQDRFTAAARSLGLEENFIHYLQKEREYGAARQRWDQYNNWTRTRNTARAELEAKYGYDTKHAGHLVRLLRMCREILTEGRVIVYRPDAEEIKSIRAGAWSYDQLIGWAQEQEAGLEELYQKSPLPKFPNREKLDSLCQEIVGAML